MDEDKLNRSVRKFLKEVGVTSQREIEKWAREHASNGGGRLALRMALTAPGTALSHTVEGEIELE